MELMRSVLILALIAALWLLVVFIVFKRVAKKQKKKDQYMLFIGLSLFFVIGAIFLIGTGVMHEMESPEFCGKLCHTMEPYYEDYDEPGNNTMMETHVEEEITCGNCHDGPSIDGKVKALTLTAGQDVYAYVTGDFDEDDLGGHVPIENCMKCHDGSEADMPGNITTAIDTEADPHDDSENCAHCHDPHIPGNGLTAHSCSVCHGLTMDDFTSSLEAHADRVDTACEDCHDRDHPDNALVPFDTDTELIDNDFCSDCHDTQFFIYNTTSTADTIELYGGCTDCHIDHNSQETPHLDSEDYEDCQDCHVGYQQGVDIHNRNDISFINRTVVEDVFCSDCHDAEYRAFSSSSDSEETTCFDCHVEHTVEDPPHLVTEPYDDCGSCHINYDSSGGIHNITGISFVNNTELDDLFCDNCHVGTEERLNLANHSRKDCTYCHQEHALGMDFTSCLSCKTHEEDIPSGHDLETNGCEGCHDLTKVHAIQGEG